jgi:hypothetical protein
MHIDSYIHYYFYSSSISKKVGIKINIFSFNLQFFSKLVSKLIKTLRSISWKDFLKVLAHKIIFPFE